MRIATWNVNSIRTRELRLLAWLDRFSPDVLCLQETKVVDDSFPFAILADRGYQALVHGQKTYNGVALISKLEGRDVQRGFEDEGDDSQARFISARFGSGEGVRVASAYIPNGSKLDSDKYPYKREWMRRLDAWIAREGAVDEDFALCGDYNIAMDDRDMNDVDRWSGGVLYNKDVIADLQALLDRGLVDAFRLKIEEGDIFTWWDYRQLSFQRNDGLRIDHALVSKSLAERCTGVEVDRDQRKKGTCPEGSKPSDHAPVIFDFEGDLQ